ncbi:MAG: dolichyl-diphosphooligosaccharide--protein glycosyltransferase subunit STT3, partial [Methanobacterium sp.]|nr:dolichyl-diphosphooligosaccharide--protein glycosyltransferase subunit STT3 [Methanobacterium sp.]
MVNKETLTKIICVIFIFSLGFLIRLDSINLPGTINEYKGYYQDSNGLPYMFELDSYYNYRLTQNFIEHGYIGDTKINGIEWDMHSYYPPGVPMDYPPLIVYLSS